MDDDDTNVRALTESMKLRGAPAWATDGESIIVAAYHDGAPRLFRVSLDGRATVSFLSEHSIDPMWSPDGRFLAYSGPDVGTTFPVKAASADGRPYPMSNLTLSRGGGSASCPIGFLPDRRGLVVLRGESSTRISSASILIPGPSGGSRTSVATSSSETSDVSRDGREIVFDRVQENSDIVVIDRLPR